MNTNRTIREANCLNVNCETMNGTAGASIDYISKFETLMFSPGVTQQLFSVTIIPDTLVEPDKTFFVHVRSFGAVSLNRDAEFRTCTILDDDTPVLSINNISVGPVKIFTTEKSFLSD